MAQKTGRYILMIIFVGLAYLGDVATCDESGAFTVSQDVFATEADGPDCKYDVGGPDLLRPSNISFPPEPPLELYAALSLESEETTKWLDDLPLLPRAPPRAGLL